MLIFKNDFMYKKSKNNYCKYCIFLFLIKQLKISAWILFFLSMSYIQFVPITERITFVHNSNLCPCIQIL